MPRIPARTRPDAQDDQPDLAGHDPDRRHAAARREAEALRLRPRVADHDGRAEGRRGEQRAVGDPDRLEAGRDAEVDDHLAGAVEDRVHERAEVADPAGRPGERAVEHVEDAAQEDDDAAGEPELLGDEDGAARP